MPFSGMNISEVISLLGRSRNMLSQSGILAELAKTATFPFGEGRPLYNTEDVHDWWYRLRRRDAMVAMGYISAKAPLMDALKYSSSDFDVECPNCSGWAYGYPEEAAEYARLCTEGAWPRQLWCPKCGVLHNDPPLDPLSF